MITFDPEKNRINQQKHDVDFCDVEGVFYDPHALVREDKDHNEARFVALGTDLYGRLLVVAYTYRDDGIRIISARHATKSERNAYERILK